MFQILCTTQQFVCCERTQATVQHCSYDYFHQVVTENVGDGILKSVSRGPCSRGAVTKIFKSAYSTCVYIPSHHSTSCRRSVGMLVLRQNPTIPVQKTASRNPNISKFMSLPRGRDQHMRSVFRNLKCEYGFKLGARLTRMS